MSENDVTLVQRSAWFMSRTWQEDCLYWRRRVLRGQMAHYCVDDLPVDETTAEFEKCACFDQVTAIDLASFDVNVSDL